MVPRLNNYEGKNKMEYQENENISPEYLEKLAFDYKSDNQKSISTDLYNVANTLKLKNKMFEDRKTEIENLERQTKDLKDQLEAAKSYQSKLSEIFDPLVSQLFNQKIDEFIRGKLSHEVDLLIDDSDTVSTLVNDIEDLRGQVDDFEIDGDQIAETVRDMIRDGDISVNLEVN
jgi:predicted  nucleic acid-binding Zn-ribbon protein